MDDNKDVVCVGQEELDDVYDDQFGRPFSELYREINPDYKKTHVEGLIAIDWLKRHYL